MGTPNSKAELFHNAERVSPRRTARLRWMEMGCGIVCGEIPAKIYIEYPPHETQMSKQNPRSYN